VSESTATCWTVIEGAAAGRREEREAFARRYLPVVRAYLAARWRGSPLAGEIDDAAQEVFVDCFKGGGALGRVDRTREGGFRAYLCGVIRNVALRAERSHAQRRAGTSDSSFDADEIAAESEALSSVFEREWAASLLKQARALQAERAAAGGDAAVKRVELLRLRFEEGLPIREIAVRTGEDAERVHREYAKARDEFRDALREVVLFHHPGTTADADAECARLLHAIR
jgi:RNA polymerase sigma-70 factor (ECF subfamily)